jgi:uncharacterized protein YndB with AHSA1/START domain
MSSAVRHSVLVDAPPETTFELFTQRLLEWWPREYTWAGSALEKLVIEPREGGRCYELGPHGFQLDWGRVLVCEAPRQLVFTWQIEFDRSPQPNPARASEVEVRFAPEGAAATQVELEHRGFERHADGEKYRAAMAGPRAWPWMLERLAEVAR